jgi:hypothetical protein
MTDEATRRAMFWSNPATGNQPTGGAGAPSAASSADWRRPRTGLCGHQRAIVAGDTAARVFLTSPDPDADACKELMRRPGVRVVTQDWRLHPEDRRWYERQREEEVKKISA